jgi:hypothetical protein
MVADRGHWNPGLNVKDDLFLKAFAVTQICHFPCAGSLKPCFHEATHRGPNDNCTHISCITMMEPNE